MPLKLRLALSFVFCCALSLFSAAPSPAKVNRHDIIIMKNGDRLTGEVKKLEGGVLYVSTDYFSGSVGLDWSLVDKVETTAEFQVTLANGERLAGVIAKVPAKDSTEKDFSVREGGVEKTVSSTDVVDVETQKSTFWRQLTGSIDFGYSFTSGNNQSSLSSDANVTYTTTKWGAGVGYNSSFSGQSGGTTTNIFEVQAFGTRFLSRNSLLIGLSDFLHSSQQDLNLRTTLGGGYGRYIKRTNRNTLRWIAGADYTRAIYQSAATQPAQQDLEMLLGIQFQYFHFDRYSLQSQLLVFPGLTDWGRVRLTTNNTFSMKLSNNFRWNFSFWDNFDSRPPLNASKNATGLSTGLGWNF
jgi:putative salt-induced outer membrane protein YdiY